MSRHLITAGAAAAALAGALLSAQAPDPFTQLARASLAQTSGTLQLPGLSAEVEVIRDRWGVPHIYAKSVDDLFMAQGFVMAQDRLWQMDMWRRQAEGRMAEILGPQAVERDRIARMLKYRGPMDDREWTSYHPDAKRIFTAYAAGVNAFIKQSAANLPVEFKITGITPEPWSAETLLLRAGTFGNASAELNLARNVVRLGRAQANKQSAPDPWDELELPEGLDLASIADNVAVPGGRGGAARPALIAPYNTWPGARGGGAGNAGEIAEPGSNNWVVSGRLSATGKPVVVNDPHRTVGNPSLRYIVHLVAPGWNVIGAGEPPFVGVAIGHNERVAWGLTIVGTDQEDVYVEEVNPANPMDVRFRCAWEPMRVVREEIRVKNQAPVAVEIKYTRHGPVFFEDAARNRAYALRSALLEPGTAPYLGGLRLAQTTNCKQFLAAAMYWKSPSENLICGDVDGNIAWQASALTPNRQAPAGDRTRRSWVGRLPVPGTGAYEWEGFRSDLPRELNPARGFVATANNNVQPQDYRPPLMFKSSANTAYDRITRLLQLITPDRQYSLDDHRRMQGDALHLRAASEVPLFRGWASADPEVERARALLAAWDGTLARTSAAAAIHSAWRTASAATERDTARPASERQAQHEASLRKAIASLRASQGENWNEWRWGRMHTRAFPHALVTAFNLPTVERPGGTGTVAADGASYREVLDVADWDRSIVTNVPGQSAQPGSPYYGNLLQMWANDEYFPLLFSRKRIEADAAQRLILRR